MCDPYDDERMRAFWRALGAERDTEVVSTKKSGEHDEQILVLLNDATPSKARPKPMLR